MGEEATACLRLKFWKFLTHLLVWMQKVLNHLVLADPSHLHYRDKMMPQTQLDLRLPMMILFQIDQFFHLRNLFFRVGFLLLLFCFEDLLRLLYMAFQLSH